MRSQNSSSSRYVELVSNIVTSDGVRIAYDAWGSRDGSPVLMIQGLGMNARGWALQRGAFGRNHRCIAIDNRGTGHSDAPPGPYDLVRMAQDAIEVLDAEGIASAHVVGASMGGVIAQILGVTHPERVHSLVLACTACRHHAWRRELLAEWAELVTARRHAGHDRRRHALARRAAPAASVRRVRERAGPGARADEAGGVRRADRRDPRDARRHARRAAHDHRAHARDHRLAGHAHAARRCRGDGRADHDLAPLRAARRRARPDGRDARTRSTTRCSSSSPRSTPPACAPFGALAPERSLSA